ncbi:oligosaccharide flippase family protein [Pedobacter arcticus]|uniref:oligosaccharide flippase family protein n=1 Tax=Pedobacter arcticus TaxID=752140 RepID=UPI000307ECA4|nr:oligosaccharide flippase family protein [Pedobacter arcticus]
MNLLKKQGFFNSITLYIGTGLGFFNLIILFQRSLTAEQIGFFGLMTSVSLLYTQFAALGFNSVITRYFPYFRSEDRKHQGFPTYVFKITSIGFLIVTAVYVFGKEFVIDFKGGNKGSSYYYQYYYLIIPVALFTFWYSLAETFARTTYHNILPSFLREVLLKVFTTIGVGLVYFQWLDYQDFVYWYVIANGVILLTLLAYLKKLDLLRFKAVEAPVKEKSSEILRYGLYSMLAGSSITMIQNIDTIMLKIYTSEEMVGYYFTLFAMALVINLPAKAFGITSYQIIADAWKTDDLKRINKVYSKTSLVQFMIGCLFLVGLIANWHNILIMLKKPEYADFYYVFIVVALGFLVDITGGLNGIIIIFSKKFKIMMPILLSAVALCALLNVIFIPMFGILGAALAYSITTLALNFTYWLYLLLKYGLQPFSFAFIKLIIIALAVLFIGIYLPVSDSFFLDVLFRSSLMAVIYLCAVYFLHISTDINEAINQVLNKLKSK